MFLTGTLVLLNSYALSFNDYSYMYYLYIIIIWRRHRCNKAHFCLNFDLPYGYLHVTLLDPTLLYQLWQQGFNDTLTQFLVLSSVVNCYNGHLLCSVWCPLVLQPS